MSAHLNFVQRNIKSGVESFLNSYANIDNTVQCNQEIDSKEIPYINLSQLEDLDFDQKMSTSFSLNFDEILHFSSPDRLSVPQPLDLDLAQNSCTDNDQSELLSFGSPKRTLDVSVLNSSINSESTCCNSPANKAVKKQEKRTKKKKSATEANYTDKKQNKMKNFPGLIMQHIKTEVIDKGAFGRKVLSRLDNNQKQALKTLLQRFNKQWKTWKKLTQFIGSSRTYGSILLDIVSEFLSHEGSSFFLSWIDNGKMKADNKQLIKERKEFFVMGYGKIREEINSRFDEDESEIDGGVESDFEVIAKKIKLDKPSARSS